MDSDAEFLEDFGSAGLSEAQLDQLLARAQSTDDQGLRLLVQQYRTLRRVAGWLLQSLDEDRDAAAVRNAESTKLLRFLVAPPSANSENP